MSGPTVDQETYQRGIPTVRYDLLKELVLAFVASGIVILVLAIGLSSPEVPPLTIQTWAQQDPIDFVTTATSELAGTSFSGAYGPPYTDGSDSVQVLGPFAPQQWAGNAVHLDAAQDFVLGPLGTAAVGNPDLTSALSAYAAADDATRQGWLSAYTDALGSATTADGQVVVAAGSYGPVPVLMANLAGVARSGGLDGLLLSGGHFFETNYTRPLLFMGDGSYLAGLAENQHLLGSQWGMMNETGSYPGQAWLWLYSMWYQIPPYNTASNADLLVVLTMLALTLVLAFVPHIPILRDIPRWIPIHRLIWRDYYRWQRTHSSPTTA
jgi:hypothetical protein